MDFEVRNHCYNLATDGNKYALNGDFLKAVQLYTEAIKIMPMEFGLFLNRSLCYIKMDFYYLALLDINQAVKLFGQYAKSYFIRSHILKKLNEFELAEQDLLIASELDPDCEDINEEITRIKDQSEKETYLFKDKLSAYDLNDKTYYKIKTNFHLVHASDLPTNIWDYEGVRVENIGPDVPLTVIRDYFALFGNIKDMKRIFPRVANQPHILVYYFNPVTPMFTIAYFQNRIIKELCAIDPNDGSYKPLTLYFVPTDSQIDLKFSRPKHPISSSHECYYWRTTSCQLNEHCPKLHIPANKNIDTQIWMVKKN